MQLCGKGSARRPGPWLALLFGALLWGAVAGDVRAQVVGVTGETPGATPGNPGSPVPTQSPTTGTPQSCDDPTETPGPGGPPANGGNGNGNGGNGGSPMDGGDEDETEEMSFGRLLFRLILLFLQDLFDLWLDDIAQVLDDLYGPSEPPGGGGMPPGGGGGGMPPGGGGGGMPPGGDMPPDLDEEP